MKQSPKLPAEKRKAQLVHAAMEVFNRKGYDGATTEDIAREAGVTKGALYFHFRSKEDIFLEVVKETGGRHMKTTVDYLLRQPDPDKFIEKIITYSIGHLLKEKHLTLELWQQAHKIKKVREYIARTHNMMVNDIAEYMHKNCGISRKKADSLIWIMHALWDGILVQRFCYQGRFNYKEETKQIIEMLQLYLNKHKAMDKV
jgi:AcrR family transcriptional regulator